MQWHRSARPQGFSIDVSRSFCRGHSLLAPVLATHSVEKNECPVPLSPYDGLARLSGER